MWNVGTQIAWLPVRNFEIGIEALYARTETDIRRANVQTVNGAVVAAPGTTVTRDNAGNWTGRMRVERTF